MSAEEVRWFAARFVCRHPGLEGDRRLYEERIVLVRARSDAEAMAKADRAAAEYASACGGIWVGEYVCTYETTLEEQVGDGDEVWSLMRDSSLREEDYLKRYFVTGEERARDMTQEP
jgi:hypothetical protein